MALRVVFMGTPDYGVPSLEALISAGYDVAGVFCQPDKPSGRGKRIAFCPVKQCFNHTILDRREPRKAIQIKNRTKQEGTILCHLTKQIRKLFCHHIRLSQSGRKCIIDQHEIMHLISKNLLRLHLIQQTMKLFTRQIILVKFRQD